MCSVPETAHAQTPRGAAPFSDRRAMAATRDRRPHPTSSKGNAYILTVIDHFTKWVEIFPMKNQEASTVAKLLFDRIICVHGFPLQILTDRGTNFESELFQELCKLMLIDKIHTTVYQPSTNDGIERFCTTMHSLIPKWVAQNHRDSDEKLPSVAFAYHLQFTNPQGPPHVR